MVAKGEAVEFRLLVPPVAVLMMILVPLAAAVTALPTPPIDDIISVYTPCSQHNIHIGCPNKPVHLYRLVV